MTYEYACKGCGHIWEAEQKITEDSLTDCPKCGKPEAKRLIGKSTFILQGSGWYKDGY